MQDDVELLEEQINALTRQLKSMVSTDRGYQELWNRRRELKGYLREALIERGT